MNDNIIFGNTVRDSLLSKQIDNEIKRAKTAEQLVLEKAEFAVNELEEKIDQTVQHIAVNDPSVTETQELETLTLTEPEGTSNSYQITRVRRVINCLSSSLKKTNTSEDENNDSN